MQRQSPSLKPNVLLLRNAPLLRGGTPTPTQTQGTRTQKTLDRPALPQAPHSTLAALPPPAAQMHGSDHRNHRRSTRRHRKSCSKHHHRHHSSSSSGSSTRTLPLSLACPLLYLARVNVTEPKEVLNIGFLSHYPFLKTLFPSFLHHHCLQFLYPTNFLVRECFSLLV